MMKLNNNNLEQTILCSIIYEPELYTDFKGELNELFYHPFHKAFLAAIEELDSKKLPICEEFIKMQLDKTDSYNEEAFFDILAVNPISNIKPYIIQLSELANLRKMREGAVQVIRNIDSGEESAAEIVQRVVEISELKDFNLKTTAQSFNTLVEYYETQTPPPKFSTGISFLDSIYRGGLVMGQLILLGGEPNAGKTSIGIQILKNISEANPTLFFSWEFTLDYFIATQRQQNKDYDGKNLYITNKGNTLSEALVEIRHWAKQGVRFVLIDSQMRMDNQDSRFNTVEDFESGKFSAIARLAHELNIVVIFIVQTGKFDMFTRSVSVYGSKKAQYEASNFWYMWKQPRREHDDNGVALKKEDAGEISEDEMPEVITDKSIYDERRIYILKNKQNSIEGFKQVKFYKWNQSFKGMYQNTGEYKKSYKETPIEFTHMTY